MKSAIRRSGNHFNRGFTVVELLITVAVAAILLGVALPSFSTLLHKNRLTSTASELYGSLNVARNTAIKQRASVSVCPSTNGSSCSGEDWGNGWIVFEDPDRDGVKDDDETVVRWVSTVHAMVDIRSTGAGANRVTFNPTGDARSTTGSFAICHKKTSAKAKLLSVSAVGRIDLSNRNQTNCSFGS